MTETKTKDPEFSYEDARNKLVSIVNTLEEGNDDLDKSLKLWEEGAKLSKECKNYLESAKKKLES